jgi:16S rRNA (adenine(1408)-N(1))-methyltransferase
VTIHRVIGTNRTVEMTAQAFEALRAQHERVLVDVGTGDGRYAHARALAAADTLVIGIDALEEPMGESARKANRRPDKGGSPNLLFVRASVEHVPEELRASADTVTVMLPWGRLLEGIVLGDERIWSGVAALAQPRARFEITLNGEIWESSTPARYADLPVPTPEYVARVVAPAAATVGIELGAARLLDAQEAKALPSTWARKLGHGRSHPRFVRVDGSGAATTSRPSGGPLG